MTRTFFVIEYFIVEEISLDVHPLEFVDFGIDQLSEVLEVQQLLQEVLHIGSRFTKPGRQSDATKKHSHYVYRM